jgi:transcriptional regulator with XRE-family HTH domain
MPPKPRVWTPEEVQILQRIAANTARRRIELGLTQEKLAKRLGEVADRVVEVRIVQRVEGGKVDFGVTLLVHLARALKVPMVSLFKPAKLAAARRGRPRKPTSPAR